MSLSLTAPLGLHRPLAAKQLRPASHSAARPRLCAGRALPIVAAVCQESSTEVSGRQFAAVLQSRVGRLATKVARHAVLQLLRVLVAVIRRLQQTLATWGRQGQLHRESTAALDYADTGSVSSLALQEDSEPLNISPAGGVASMSASMPLQPEQPAPTGASSPTAEAPATAPSGWAALVSAATSGAASLHETLNDAAAGIGEKVTALHVSAASSVGEALFHATSASAAMLDDLAASGVANPTSSSKMWRHATTQAVLSEEERLRQAVFQQVYAELTKSESMRPRP